MTAASAVVRPLSRTYVAFTTRRMSWTGAALLRIGYGVTLIGILLANMGVRDELWGPDGLYPWEEFSRSLGDRGYSFSLYVLSSSDWWAELLFFSLLAACVLLVLGWRTRIVLPVLWVLVWSWGERNPFLADSGDNLMRIVLIYLCLSDCAGRLSLDARRRNRSTADRTSARWRAGSILHNTAILAIATQLCLVYINAGLYKVQGGRWQEGTALYYILRVADYTPFPELSRLVYEHGTAVLVLTYITTFFQAFFPLLLLRAFTRHLAFAMACLMHIGIGVLMGIPFFSMFLIATDLILLSDREYAWMTARWRRYVRERHFRKRSPVPTSSVPSSVPCPTRREALVDQQR
jgi:hypothetical protein